MVSDRSHARNTRTAVARAPPGGFRPTGHRAETGFEWFCVSTEFNKEILALQSLRSIGICTWLPEYAAENGRIQPLFPRYLFAQLDLERSPWGAVYRQPGVTSVLGPRHERPTAIPERALEVLWDQCAPNGVVYPSAGYERLPQGVEVRLIGGRYAGFVGVCRWPSGTRVAILLTTVAGERQISARRENVAAVAHGQDLRPTVVRDGCRP